MGQDQASEFFRLVPVAPPIDDVGMENAISSRWMSWGASLAEDFGERTAVIQLLNPDMLQFHLGAQKQLVLQFWDRSELQLGEAILAFLFGSKPDLCVRMHRIFLGNNGGWPWRPPLADDARRIREFVDSIPQGWDFVVTCEYGHSRSRAVAEWIADRRKIKAVGDSRRGSPNARLADLLAKE